MAFPADPVFSLVHVLEKPRIPVTPGSREDAPAARGRQVEGAFGAAASVQDAVLRQGQVMFHSIRFIMLSIQLGMIPA